MLEKIGVQLIRATCCLAAVAAMAAGGSSKPSTSAPPDQGPEQQALEYFNSGIAERDRAWQIEKKMAVGVDPTERTKLTKKLGKAYTAAAADFERATRANPEMYEAHSDLGYCLRKLGDYERSLEHYDTALEIRPDYGNAIEYRGETYLALSRLDDAKSAYMELFRGDRGLADQLLAAMQAWVTEQRSDPGGGGAKQVEGFAEWVAERSEIAAQTKPISQLHDSDW